MVGDNTNPLMTHSCLQILMSVVCTSDTYDHNLRIENGMKKVFEENFELVPEQEFSMKYFLKTGWSQKDI